MKKEDTNAKLAFEATCEYAYNHDNNLFKWKDLSDCEKSSYRRYVMEDRLKHLLEQSEAKTMEQNGTFVCESGYAFKNKVEECEHYRIYRCDGGHHFAVVYIEHKEQAGSSGNEIKYVVKNGQLVPEIDAVRKNDQFEID